MTNVLQQVLNANRSGVNCGIPSVCTIHPLVLEAAMQHAKEGAYPILVETTANQVNQYGGYSGMQPDAARDYILSIAERVGLDRNQLVLGGDHLGPVCWASEPAESAMQRSVELVQKYVRAGFEKIHLDCSMPCADDPEIMSDEIIADRAATLCAAAEVASAGNASKPLYVVGTEVPTPGGAAEDVADLAVTSVESVRQTIDIHRQAFDKRGLNEAWDRVIAVVVQPGVEFDHVSVHDYQPCQSRDLANFIQSVPSIVFEAHSTDYQLPGAYVELVKQHFAILKVGPQLTFALREALFALSHIESELIELAKQSNLRQACEDVMKEYPASWEKHYSQQQESQRLLRRFSFSDRIRYYWQQTPIETAVDALFNNLSTVNIPIPLLSQYCPLQYTAIRNGEIEARAEDIVRHHLFQVLNDYSAACVSMPIDACESRAL